MLHYRRTRFHLTRPVYNAEHGNLKLPPGFGREGVTARRVSGPEFEKFEKANAVLQRDGYAHVEQVFLRQRI